MASNNQPRFLPFSIPCTTLPAHASGVEEGPRPHFSVAARLAAEHAGQQSVVNAIRDEVSKLWAGREKDLQGRPEFSCFDLSWYNEVKMSWQRGEGLVAIIAFKDLYPSIRAEIIKCLDKAVVVTTTGFSRYAHVKTLLEIRSVDLEEIMHENEFGWNPTQEHMRALEEANPEGGFDPSVPPDYEVVKAIRWLKHNGFPGSLLGRWMNDVPSSQAFDSTLPQRQTGLAYIKLSRARPAPKRKSQDDGETKTPGKRGRRRTDGSSAQSRSDPNYVVPAAQQERNNRIAANKAAKAAKAAEKAAAAKQPTRLKQVSKRKTKEASLPPQNTFPPLAPVPASTPAPAPAPAPTSQTPSFPAVVSAPIQEPLPVQPHLGENIYPGYAPARSISQKLSQEQLQQALSFAAASLAQEQALPMVPQLEGNVNFLNGAGPIPTMDQNMGPEQIPQDHAFPNGQVDMSNSGNVLFEEQIPVGPNFGVEVQPIEGQYRMGGEVLEQQYGEVDPSLEQQYGIVHNPLAQQNQLGDMEVENNFPAASNEAPPVFEQPGEFDLDGWNAVLEEYSRGN